MNERPTLRVILQLPAANDSERDAAKAFLAEVHKEVDRHSAAKKAFEKGLAGVSQTGFVAYSQSTVSAAAFSLASMGAKNPAAPGEQVIGCVVEQVGSNPPEDVAADLAARARKAYAAHGLSVSEFRIETLLIGGDRDSRRQPPDW